MKIRLFTILLGVLLLTGCSNEDIFLAGRDLWYPSDSQLKPVSSDWGLNVTGTSTFTTTTHEAFRLGTSATSTYVLTTDASGYGTWQPAEISTSTLVNYLYKPGISGGQTAYGGSNSTDNLTLYSNPYQDGKIFLGANTWLNEPINQFVIGLDPDTYGFQDYNIPLMVAGYQNTYYGLNVFNLLDGDSASAVLVAATAPTSYVTLGQASVSNTQSEYGAMVGGSSFLMTANSDLYIGSGGISSTTGNVYIASGGLDSTDKLRVVFTYDGKVGIGTLNPTFPLQVAGRARFNDSVGVDTDPSTFGLDLRGSLNFVATQPPTTTPTATLAGAPGNVDKGTHRYKVNYYTSLGDTNLSSVYTFSTVVSSTIDGQVSLTNIPTSNDNKVIGRRIYRTKANQTTGYHLLTTIANNTATTYTDNTADADLDSTTYDGLDNFTRGHIYLDGDDAGFFGNTNFGLGIGSLADGAKFTGGYNFALGTNSLNSLTSGKANAGLGASTLRSLTSGSYNTAIGYYSGYSLTTGNSNTVIGQSSLVKATTGYSNSAIGVNTLNRLTEGYINVAVGSNSLHNLTTGHNNVGIGYASGYNNVTGTGNLFLGYFAGGNEMGSNKLYIANSNTSNPLIYGEFDNSYLKVNGKLNITGDTYWTGSGSGIPYGHMTNDLGDTITITTQNVWVEASSTVWTTGLTNLVTFGGKHYLAVDKAGVYEVIISASISDAGINDTVGIAVMVNGTAQTAGHAQATLGTANTQSSLSTSYILNLSANDQISLGVVNHSGTTNLDLQHASITLKMIGG